MMNSESNPLHFLLDTLPYRLSFYDENLELMYSNNKSDGIFFPSEEEQVLPKWIWQKLEDSNTHDFHMEIPSDSFDRILVQSYQMVFNQDSEFAGVVSYIQDIKPLLASYLKGSGQAIVGWSDVTSGPSIKNDTVDDLDQKDKNDNK